jgi:hypothetical protein
MLSEAKREMHGCTSVVTNANIQPGEGPSH